MRLATENNPTVVAASFDEAAARDNIDLQFGALLPQVSAQAQAFRIEQQHRARVAPDRRADHRPT